YPVGMCRRMFEGAHNGRADGDDAPSARPHSTDRNSGSPRNAVRFIERQQPVQLVVSRGRDAGRVREGGERDAAGAHCRQRPPIQGEAGRWRLEGDRRTCDRRPYVPQGERDGDMRVLDWPAVARQAGPDRIRRAVEAQRHETRVTEQAFDGRREWPEDKSIAWLEARRRGSVLGAREVIARAEHDGGKLANVVRGE